jgi:hypothetical protein
MTTRKNVIHVKSPTATELIQVIGKVGSPSERKKLLNMLPAGTRVKIFNQMAKEESPRSLALKLKRVSPGTRAQLMQALPAGTRARVRWASMKPKLREIIRLSQKKRVPFPREFAQNLQAEYVREGRKSHYKSNEEQKEHEFQLMMNGWKHALARINKGAKPPNVGPVQRRASPPKQFNTKYKAHLRSFFHMQVPNVQIHANGMGVPESLLYEMMNANYRNKSGRVAPTYVKNKRPKVKGGVRALVSGKRRLAKTYALSR